MNNPRLLPWAVGSILLVILALWFSRDRKPEPTPDQEHEASHTPLPTPPPASLLRSARPDDCVSCPPGTTAEFMKRNELPPDVRACIELMVLAAEDGIPDPDASHLENCNETPLFHAYTAEQVQTLLDAGADPNVHGEFGHTPLYRQLHVAVTRPSYGKAKLLKDVAWKRRWQYGPFLYSDPSDENSESAP